MWETQPLLTCKNLHSIFVEIRQSYKHCWSPRIVIRDSYQGSRYAYPAFGERLHVRSAWVTYLALIIPQKVTLLQKARERNTLLCAYFSHTAPGFPEHKQSGKCELNHLGQTGYAMLDEKRRSWYCAISYIWLINLRCYLILVFDNAKTTNWIKPIQLIHSVQL